ncbi:MAG: hypothetical protein Q8P05_05075 [Candidatus Diapherotrites archaeon]|nr:hypothetical protein [Candidatus Diapherotrites archaeon]MDZ4256860.1 hypothetical protein [archaeon]
MANLARRIGRSVGGAASRSTREKHSVARAVRPPRFRTLNQQLKWTIEMDVKLNQFSGLVEENRELLVSGKGFKRDKNGNVIGPDGSELVGGKVLMRTARVYIPALAVMGSMLGTLGPSLEPKRIAYGGVLGAFIGVSTLIGVGATEFINFRPYQKPFLQLEKALKGKLFIASETRDLTKEQLQHNQAVISSIVKRLRELQEHNENVRTLLIQTRKLRSD